MKKKAIIISCAAVAAVAGGAYWYIKYKGTRTVKLRDEVAKQTTKLPTSVNQSKASQFVVKPEKLAGISLVS